MNFILLNVLNSNLALKGYMKVISVSYGKTVTISFRYGGSNVSFLAFVSGNGAGGRAIYHGFYQGSSPQITQMMYEVNGGTFSINLSSGNKMAITGGTSNYVSVVIVYTDGIEISE